MHNKRGILYAYGNKNRPYEWLQKRKEGIGGSDAGIICGLNPYFSSISVYQDKISTQIEERDNEAMRQGRELKDYVARRFMEAAGLKVRRANWMYKSTQLECKTASVYQKDHWKEDRIPPHYMVQCLH